MKNLLKNWKTTLAGIISAVSILGAMFNFISHDQAMAIGGLAASFGLLTAKDGNVTGGSTPQ